MGKLVALFMDCTLGKECIHHQLILRIALVKSKKCVTSRADYARKTQCSAFAEQFKHNHSKYVEKEHVLLPNGKRSHLNDYVIQIVSAKLFYHSQAYLSTFIHEKFLLGT